MANGSSQGDKVQKVINEWGLLEIGDELEQRWLGRARDEHSLRELAEYFNKQVLVEALTESGTVPLEGEVENLYHLLTGEDVNRASKIQTEQRLTELGIAVEDLTDDFVSHQTMYRYLKNHRGVQKQTEKQSTEELVDSVRRASTRLSNRLKTVIRKNLETLNNRSEFHIGEFDIYVDIQIACSECNTTRELSQILERNGCDCR